MAPQSSGSAMVLAAIAAALLACARGADRAPGAAHAASVSPPVVASQRTDDPRVAAADRARTQGVSSARLWVIIASDFQCPWCRVWHDSTFATIKREYVDTGKIRLAYVNLPLPMHPNARPAAEAAMCAGAQNKFWEMHDELFNNQDKWASTPAPAGVFESLAAGVGVDTAAFRACVASGVMRPMIEADRERMVSARVRSTPSFFVGSRRIEGAAPATQFRSAIDDELAAASAVGPVRR